MRAHVGKSSGEQGHARDAMAEAVARSRGVNGLDFYQRQTIPLNLSFSPRADCDWPVPAFRWASCDALGQRPTASAAGSGVADPRQG